ncbi:MAG: hypothetical protein K2O78_09275 [Muribaculaceae bacterium]|nr:hypothetical protein [Muribaculaceae bacterium]
MKNLFTPLAIALAAMPALAQNSLSFSPPEGNVDMATFPAGLSSFEIIPSEPVSINREAEGFISLSLDGDIVKQIPASNIRDLYTFSGYTKTDAGDLHVTFFQRQQTSPFRYLGRYTVTVPAGFLIYADGSANDEISVDYLITTPAYSVTPASGEKLEAISSADISFNGIVSLSVNPAMSDEALSSLSVAFTPEGAAKAITFPIDISAVSVEGTQVAVTFPQAFDAPGALELSVPAGLFLVRSDAGVDGSNDEIIASWTTGAIPVPEISYTVSPEPGSYGSFTSEYFPAADKYAFFRIEMPEGVTISGFPSLQHPLLAPVSGGVTDLENPFFSFSAQAVAADNSLYLYNGAYNTESAAFAYRSQSTLTPPPGEYRLYIPENTFTLSDGTRNLPFEFPFSVEENPDGAPYEISPDPLFSITPPLSEIRIEFNSAAAIQWVKGNYVTLTDGIAEYVLEPAVAYPDNGTGAALLVDIPGAGITQQGVYTLSIPAAALLVDSTPTAVNATLYIGVDAPPVTGINSVNAPAGSHGAYTVSGCPADPAHLSGGLYIIGGKKILKR